MPHSSCRKAGRAEWDPPAGHARVTALAAEGGRESFQKEVLEKTLNKKKGIIFPTWCVTLAIPISWSLSLTPGAFPALCWLPQLQGHPGELDSAPPNPGTGTPRHGLHCPKATGTFSQQTLAAN